MGNIVWELVKPLNQGKAIDSMESRYQIKLPADLRACIIKNNGGSPYPCTFDFGENKGKTFGGLLSFNEGDTDSIYKYIKAFETSDGKGVKMFPFGIDPAGNFLCVKNGNIVFYYHETEQECFICKTFTELLDRLYE